MASIRMKQGSVGARGYVVKQGDCMSKIAEETGFLWQTIWEHPENECLRTARNDPNVLFPGDQVFIPEKQVHFEPKVSDQRHRFEKRGVPAKLRLKIEKLGRARANEEYNLNIDGKWMSGRLDPEGRLEVPIPPDALQGRLEVGLDRQTFEFKLGGVDPVDEISGIQTRLNNLGYGSGEADGVLGTVTELAIKSFQKDYRLPPTGEADDATLQKLREIHGS